MRLHMLGLMDNGIKELFTGRCFTDDNNASSLIKNSPGEARIDLTQTDVIIHRNGPVTGNVYVLIEYQSISSQSMATPV